MSNDNKSKKSDEKQCYIGVALFKYIYMLIVGIYMYIYIITKMMCKVKYP